MKKESNINKFKIKGNVCVFGDSIVWGAWDKELLGWCNRLSKYCMMIYEDDCTVYNLGIPSDTTTGLLKRMENECNVRNPQTIIVSIGINDAIYLNREKYILTDSETFMKNVQNIIDICKSYTNNILFVGLTKVNEDFTNPISWDNNQSYFNKNIEKYNKIIKEICIENNVEFLDIFNLLDEENINIDGIHPNERGHEIIFNNIKRKMI